MKKKKMIIKIKNLFCKNMLKCYKILMLYGVWLHTYII